MDEPHGEWLCFAKHAALAEMGRVLTWLGENCETFSLVLTTPQSVTRADDALGIRVGFRDSFEAAAFMTRFPDRETWQSAQ
jgi:hypothetical protein